MTMAEDLRRESKRVRLTINLSKTKIMTNICPFKTIKIYNNPIEVVSDYKYLGQTILFDNKTKKEIKNRRKNAWQALWV